MSLDPLEALDRVIGYACLSDFHGRYGPGGLVARQSADVREALSRLTSAQTALQRVPRWACNPFWDPDPVKRSMFEAQARHKAERWMRPV